MARLSDRGEPCTACGDPLFVCPSTLRVHIRCCHRCTHRTALDDEHAKMRAWQASYTPPRKERKS